MPSMLSAFLRHLIRRGHLTLRLPDGTTQDFGPGGEPSGGMAVLDWRTVRRIVANPGLGFGEGYMDGTVVPLDCSLYELMDVLSLNLADTGNYHPLMRLGDRVRRTGRRWAQFNPAGRARRNVAHHYDLNGRLYSLFLDRDRQYSCAYFPTRHRDAGAGAGREEAPHRGQAGARPAGPRGARHRLRLGRHGADAGARLRRAGHGHHPVLRAARGGAGARRARGASPTACASSSWTTAP